MESPALSRVVTCIAQTTRYPVKLLQPTADLEIDLGIDSVKRVEIVVALGKEFGLPLADQPRDKAIRTIEDIANWVERMQADSSAAANSPTPQPVATKSGCAESDCSAESGSAASSRSTHQKLPTSSSAVRISASRSDTTTTAACFQSIQQRPV